MEKNSINLF